MLRYNFLFLPWDGEIAPVQESMKLQLKGLLCFQMIQNISQMSDCVQLYLLKLMLPGFEGVACQYIQGQWHYTLPT